MHMVSEYSSLNDFGSIHILIFHFIVFTVVVVVVVVVATSVEVHPLGVYRPS